MITYVTEKIDREVIEKISCDVCKKEFNCTRDIIDVQEFLHINFVGGYGSIFGDMVDVKCDMCQNCIKDKLGDFLRYDDE